MDPAGRPRRNLRGRRRSAAPQTGSLIRTCPGNAIRCTEGKEGSARRASLRVQYSNVEKRFGMRMALRGVSLEIASGECAALVGHNGSGKTTLLKITAQLTQPTRGTVEFFESISQPTNASATSPLLPI